VKWLIAAALTVAAAVAIARRRDSGQGGAFLIPSALFDASTEAPADPAPTTDSTSWIDSAMNSVSSAVSQVLDTGKGWAKLLLADGTVVQRDGTRAWRNNNPGNIEYGPFTIANGAIGSDGRFAIFATFEAGQAAQEKLIFETSTYRNLTLSAAIAKYAPAVENNTGRYQAAVLASVGGVDTPMRDYSSSERQAILAAMHRQEGFAAGDTTVLQA